MAAGDVHGELTVAGEPFCGLLGMAVRQKNPFVLESVCPCQYVGLHLYYSCVSPVRRVLFGCTHTLNFFINTTLDLDTNKVFIISNKVQIIRNIFVSLH